MGLLPAGADTPPSWPHFMRERLADAVSMRERLADAVPHIPALKSLTPSDTGNAWLFLWNCESRGEAMRLAVEVDEFRLELEKVRRRGCHSEFVCDRSLRRGTRAGPPC